MDPQHPAPLTVSGVAAAFGVDEHTAARGIARLLRRGYVIRPAEDAEPDPAPARPRLTVVPDLPGPAPGAYNALQALTAEAVADPRLSPAARRVFRALVHAPEAPTPSLGILAQHGSTPKARVPAALAELDAAGWIERAARIAPHLADVDGLH